MPAKKKTNFVSYELKKLDKYVKELMNYLDQNPSDKIEDRIEVMESTRGNPIIKVIASKEQQLNCYFDKLEKLPRLLEDINKLRRSVEDEEEQEVRGGSNVPGFMSKKNTGETYKSKKNDKVEIDEDFPDDPSDQKTSQLSFPNSTREEVIEVDVEEDDDAPICDPAEDEEDPWDDEF